MRIAGENFLKKNEYFKSVDGTVEEIHGIKKNFGKIPRGWTNENLLPNANVLRAFKIISLFLITPILSLNYFAPDEEQKKIL